ncbi:7558_t:CDS:2 [Entrophospora sp. SA101]|nr:7558_t:CDS:2 [Entrophospora sp. SA101]CAJ0845471.1 535_t:CDS:2 [Entrophospora sp. SA101]
MSPSKIVSHSNITKIIPNPESQPTSSSFPHFPILSSPDDVEILKQCIIINIQNKLGFSRHSVGFKRFVLEPFPENIFANLFPSQNNFSYSPAKRCYICIFKNTDGRNDLSSILNNGEWWKK